MAFRLLGVFLGPFLPDTSEAIRKMIATDLAAGSRWETEQVWGGLRPGSSIGTLQILFPRKEEDD